MAWTSWLVLAVALAGIYALGLIGYRLLVSAKELKHELARAESLVDELKQVEQEAIERSKPSSGDDFEQLLVNRELLKKARRLRAEQRKRRLIERISSIEVDKR
ncbi:MAG: hypothetical protein VW008_04560 [Aquiluna sp.]